MFPTYLVSLDLDHFGSNNPAPIGAFQDKNWTPGMIALLGEPVKKNHQQVPFFALSKAQEVMRTEEFAKELRKVAENRLKSIGGLVVENMILAGCHALYDLNKHIKAKKFTAAPVRKAYDLKTCLLDYLYKNGFVSELVFEQDTNLYRFVVCIDGNNFVWHQPLNRCGSFVPATVLVGMSSKPEVAPEPKTTHLEAMLNLERVVLSLILLRKG